MRGSRFLTITTLVGVVNAVVIVAAVVDVVCGIYCHCWGSSITTDDQIDLYDLCMTMKPPYNLCMTSVYDIVWPLYDLCTTSVRPLYMTLYDLLLIKAMLEYRGLLQAPDDVTEKKKRSYNSLRNAKYGFRNLMDPNDFKIVNPHHFPPYSYCIIEPLRYYLRHCQRLIWLKLHRLFPCHQVSVSQLQLTAVPETSSSLLHSWQIWW